MRTNCLATLYNGYISGGAQKYQRTAIGLVAWFNTKASNVLRSGLLAADSAVIYVPLALGEDYVDPKPWAALTVKTGKWTLAVGDVIVKGLVTDEIHDAVVGPPAVPAFTMTNLKAAYDDVVTIKSVDTFDMGSVSLRHWKVSGS
jgi:hypothetical protein